eukprot:TRINITY_DN8826_c0_g2_i4.p1 TRINITY_DN8826_c0_g2~~TRINITY_DN8826_c0_g2_i4.p1  ORF type:complete len:181 (+),score=22.55 TRINITY_DN8826_c0_g2_i4:202-744(+)
MLAACIALKSRGFVRAGSTLLTKTLRASFASEFNFKEIDKRWTEHIRTFKEAKTNKKSQKKPEKFYCLSQFPYPSGNLHMGHARVYTICDVIAKAEKMAGKDVINPMGWDSFGLPAENAALQRNIAPVKWTQKNIEEMRSQMDRLGFDFDWNRELSTCSCLLYTSPSPRDRQKSRMPSSA